MHCLSVLDVHMPHAKEKKKKKNKNEKKARAAFFPRPIHAHSFHAQSEVRLLTRHVPLLGVLAALLPPTKARVHKTRLVQLAPLATFL